MSIWLTNKNFGVCVQILINHLLMVWKANCLTFLSIRVSEYKWNNATFFKVVLSIEIKPSLKCSMEWLTHSVHCCISFWVYCGMNASEMTFSPLILLKRCHTTGILTLFCLSILLS
jgi:hypothetical protein